jgi:hypothetical protein
MLAVQGIFDGKSFIPLESFPSDKKYKVIITFIEEVEEAEELRILTAQTDAFDFWQSEAEDLYQDYLTK